MSDEPSTYEEWRVTGDPGDPGDPGDDYPPYQFTWSPLQGPDPGDPEGAARRFVALVKSVESWPDGPHLHHRTVTVTAWEPA